MKRHKSVLKRRLMYLLITICTLFSVILIVANTAYSRIAESKVIQRTQRNLAQAAGYLSLLMDQARESAQYISKAQEVVHFANAKVPTIYEKYIAMRRIGKEITLMAQLNTNLDSIFVYFEEAGLMATSIYGDYLAETLEDTEVYRALDTMHEYTGSVNFIQDERICKKGILSFLVKANSYNPEIHSPVYIMINFDEEKIYKILKDMESSTSSTPILQAASGEVLSAQDKSLLGQPFPLYGEGDDGYEEERWHSRKVHVFYNNQYASVFRLLYIMDSGDIQLEQSLLSGFIGGILLLFIGAGLTMHHLYYHGVYHPLIRLVAFMRETEKGDLSKRIEVDREDEFGYLYSACNEMLEKIDTLVKTTHQQDELRRRMEIRQLQKQIDPHFLYNTLDTVNWMARRHNVPEISKIVLSLSKLYQNAFNRGKLLVSYGEAVESSKCYLDIQKYRFYDKLEYQIEVNPALENCRILNLLLQSVVENAVIHGMDDMERKVMILIENQYVAEDDSVVFRVTDTGKGMSEEKLALQIKRLGCDAPASNSGLTNVQRRIKLYYGPQYGLSIYSRLGEGTRVEMHIPRMSGDRNPAAWEDEQ